MAPKATQRRQCTWKTLQVGVLLAFYIHLVHLGDAHGAHSCGSIPEGVEASPPPALLGFEQCREGQSVLDTQTLPYKFRGDDAFDETKLMAELP